MREFLHRREQPATNKEITMARPAKPVAEKTVTVAAGVAPEVKEAIEEYRWSVRMTVSDFVKAAVEEKVAALGLDLAAAKARLAEASAPTA